VKTGGSGVKTGGSGVKTGGAKTGDSGVKTGGSGVNHASFSTAFSSTPFELIRGTSSRIVPPTASFSPSSISTASSPTPFELIRGTTSPLAAAPPADISLSSCSPRSKLPGTCNSERSVKTGGSGVNHEGSGVNQ